MRDAENVWRWEEVLVMAGEGTFVNKFMHATDHVRKVLGPADQGDMDSPVVHRHDAFEDESDAELSQIIQRTDSSGHHYAIRRDEATD
ncbi:hypothetical protein [Arthrobacter sp. ERGS1:01]|uniref:hypothetical protein n=1 Tax=Arthrobacter sp. ERGS1:01 TaxID=1704044 RepID=UPI000A7719C6